MSQTAGPPSSRSASWRQPSHPLPAISSAKHSMMIKSPGVTRARKPKFPDQPAHLLKRGQRLTSCRDPNAGYVHQVCCGRWRKHCASFPFKTDFCPSRAKTRWNLLRRQLGQLHRPLNWRLAVVVLSIRAASPEELPEDRCPGRLQERQCSLQSTKPSHLEPLRVDWRESSTCRIICKTVRGWLPDVAARDGGISIPHPAVRRKLEATTVHLWPQEVTIEGVHYV